MLILSLQGNWQQCCCCVCTVLAIADIQLLQEWDEIQVAGQAPLRRYLLTVPTELEEKDLTDLQRKMAEKGLINTQRDLTSVSHHSE